MNAYMEMSDPLNDKQGLIKQHTAKTMLIHAFSEIISWM